VAETYKRSIAKALSWRLLATLVTGAVAYFITGRFRYAATIGLVDSLLKIGVYILHERLWNRISFGKAREPEYQI